MKALNLENFVFMHINTRGMERSPLAFVDGETEAWEHTSDSPSSCSNDWNPRNLTADRDMCWASLSNRLD